MQAMFQITWVKRLQQAHEETWSAISRNEFQNLRCGLEVFKSNVMSVKDFKGFGLIHSKYYCNVLKTWLHENSNNLEVTPCSEQDQNPWNNDDIRFKQNMLIFREWVNPGIHKLCHMFNDEGYFQTVNGVIEMIGNTAVRQFNSLVAGGLGYSLKLINFKLISTINILRIVCEIAIMCKPQHLTNHESTLVQVMAWCRQATSHYPNQCWPRSMLSYGITRPQWVKYNVIPAECSVKCGMNQVVKPTLFGTNICFSSLPKTSMTLTSHDY